MDTIMGTIQMLLLFGTILGLAFMICLSLPDSQLRAFLLPIVGWAVAIFCGLYCVSPIDIIPEALLGPFGLIDDVGAVVTGIAAARAALSSGKSDKANS